MIAGPTASGKSALAIDLAVQLNGEIINGDALQLYRGMDIGTAKTPVAQRCGIPHHMLDVLDITDYATVAQYQAPARQAVEDILRRGRTPILVGGTGLYLQSVVDELQFPATDPEVRRGLEAELAEHGPWLLHERLRLCDPVSAAKIEPLNSRRVVRALEVIAISGRPFSATMPVRGAFRYDAAWFCIDRDTGDLDDRIATRVSAMVRDGLVDEVRQLADRGLRRGVTASRALGYRQVLQMLDGLLTLDEAIAETVAGTRRYVRRQRSWFRRDQRQVWLRGDDPALLRTVLARARTRTPSGDL